MEVGIIGLGVMAQAMAKNLVAAGYVVKIWNRSGGEIAGATTVSSQVDALQADVTLTMLSDDVAIRGVLMDSGALAQARRGLTHAVMSTISVGFAQELVTAHEKAGIGYLSAPVLGRPDVAAEGQRNIITGGVSEAIERVRPVLEVLGKKVWEVGVTRWQPMLRRSPAT